MNRSARWGIISLVEKTGKDPLLLNNWRPLSFLNVDYKIFAKLLANHFQTVLTKWIHEDQTGFIRGRSINQNLLELINMIKYSEHENLDCLLVSFDFRKAFDTVEWDMVQLVLEKFHVGPRMQQLYATVI